MTNFPLYLVVMTVKDQPTLMGRVCSEGQARIRRRGRFGINGDGTFQAHTTDIVKSVRRREGGLSAVAQSRRQQTSIYCARFRFRLASLWSSSDEYSLLLPGTSAAMWNRARPRVAV